MKNVLNHLVFFTENGKTYFGLPHKGQFVEYKLSVSGNAAYGHGAQMTLTISGEVIQDSPDDVSVEQNEMVARLIYQLLEKNGDFTFYSQLYRTSVNFKRGDDIFDILEKFQIMKDSYGGGRIY